MRIGIRTFFFWFLSVYQVSKPALLAYLGRNVPANNENIGRRRRIIESVGQRRQSTAKSWEMIEFED